MEWFPFRAEAAGEKLTYLKDEVLVTREPFTEAQFTDYTEENGKWRTFKTSNGKQVTKTVWTRCALSRL